MDRLFAGLLPTGGAVLDLGCFGGESVSMALTTRGLKVTGIDSSPTLISLCRKKDAWPPLDNRRHAKARARRALRWHARLGQLSVEIYGHFAEIGIDNGDVADVAVVDLPSVVVHGA